MGGQCTLAALLRESAVGTLPTLLFETTMHIGNFTTERIDVQKYVDAKILPSTRVERAGVQIWLVREEPVDSPKTGAAWSFATEGNIAHIPLFPYISASEEPDGYGHFIWVVATRTVAEALGTIDMRKKKIRRLHTAFGYPVEKCGDGFKFWAGVALLLE